jgi:hypothetical protein
MGRGRRSAAIAKPVGLQRDFEKHTASVYGNMRARFAEKKDARGVVTRAGRPLPFTLREFREWLLAGAFRGSWDNAVKCCYCNTWLNAINFVPDHREPVKYSGGIGLDNLAICCEHCNLAKGPLSEDGFKRLCEFSLTLLPRDSADLFGRLKNGAGFLRLKMQTMKKFNGVKTSRNFVLPAIR